MFDSNVMESLDVNIVMNGYLTIGPGCNLVILSLLSEGRRKEREGYNPNNRHPFHVVLPLYQFLRVSILLNLVPVVYKGICHMYYFVIS